MKARGEMTINLGGQDRILVPAIGALMEFEELVGISAQELLVLLQEGKPKVRQMAAVVTVGIKWGMNQNLRHRAPKLEEVAEWMQSEGFPKIAPTVYEFLVRALADDETIKRFERLKAGEPDVPEEDVSASPPQAPTPGPNQ